MWNRLSEENSWPLFLRAPGGEELQGNAFLVFNARFFQSGSSYKAQGQTTLQIGTNYEFTSTSTDHLTLVGASSSGPAHAIWSGAGTVNGVAAGYSFKAYALASDSGDGRARIQISDSSSNVVYDSHINTPLDISSVPQAIPDAVTNVIIKDAGATISALGGETPSPDSTFGIPTVSATVYVIIIAVLGVLLLIALISVIVLAMKLRLSQKSPLTDDKFTKM